MNMKLNLPQVRIALPNIFKKGASEGAVAGDVAAPAAGGRFERLGTIKPYLPQTALYVGSLVGGFVGATLITNNRFAQQDKLRWQVATGIATTAVGAGYVALSHKGLAQVKAALPQARESLHATSTSLDHIERSLGIAIDAEGTSKVAVTLRTSSLQDAFGLFDDARAQMNTELARIGDAEKSAAMGLHKVTTAGLLGITGVTASALTSTQFGSQE